jgi:hypothetical protein
MDLTVVGEIQKWLDGHSAGLERAKQRRKILINLPPSTSYMSLFPDLITINDPELNALRLVRFRELENRLALNADTRTASSNGFEFTENNKYLASSFSLQSDHMMERKAQTRSTAFIASKRIKATEVSPPASHEPPSPIPASMDSMSSPLPPLPPGPPPSQKKLNEDEIIDSKPDTVWTPTNPILKEECVQLLMALIKIEDWPRNCRFLISAFKEQGCSFGNPFTQPVLGMELSPDKLKETSCDLKVMLNGVLNNHYSWFYQLENDLRSLLEQTRLLFPKDSTMSAIVEHFGKRLDAEIAKSYDKLANVNCIEK